MALLGALALGAVAGGVAFTRLRARPPSGGPDAGTLGDVSSPMSPNAEAAVAYAAGMTALHGASLGEAYHQLAHALDLDPRLAVAQLQLTIVRDMEGESLNASAMGSLRGIEGSLGMRDKTLIDAIEPWTSSPPDPAEAERRAIAAFDRFPSDAEMLIELAEFFYDGSRYRNAFAAVSRARELDPSSALAWMLTGEIASCIDEGHGATAAFRECLKIAPSATSCLVDLAAIQANAGECNDLLETGRRLAALSPNSSLASRRLAEGLVGLDRPVDQVREALSRSAIDEQPSQRRMAHLSGEAALAFLSGHLAEAARDLDAAADAIADDNSASALGFDYQSPLDYERMLLEEETGNAASASKRASVYLKRWSGEIPDYQMEASVIQYATGALSRSQFASVRDEWLVRHKDDIDAGQRWIAAYALPAATAEEAATALRAKPPNQPITCALFQTPSSLEPTGRTYQLAGLLDEAIPLLAMASKSCAILSVEDAVASLRATFELGKALESKGDLARACDTYARATSRWRNLEPVRSLTATGIRSRARALHCDRRDGP